MPVISDQKNLDKYAFQVLTMVEEGCSIRQIAKQFHLSRSTVMDVIEQFSEER